MLSLLFIISIYISTANAVMQVLDLDHINGVTASSKGVMFTINAIQTITIKSFAITLGSDQTQSNGVFNIWTKDGAFDYNEYNWDLMHNFTVVNVFVGIFSTGDFIEPVFVENGQSQSFYIASQSPNVHIVVYNPAPSPNAPYFNDNYIKVTTGISLTSNFICTGLNCDIPIIWTGNVFYESCRPDNYQQSIHIDEIKCGEHITGDIVYDGTGAPDLHVYSFDSQAVIWNSGVNFTLSSCFSSADTVLWLYEYLADSSCTQLSSVDMWNVAGQQECEANGYIFDANNTYADGEILKYGGNIVDTDLLIYVGQYHSCNNNTQCDWGKNISYALTLECELGDPYSISAASCDREQIGPEFTVDTDDIYEIGNGIFEQEIIMDGDFLFVWYLDYKIGNNYQHKVILSSDACSFIIEFGLINNSQLVTIRDGLTGNIIGGSPKHHNYANVDIIKPFTNMWIKIAYGFKSPYVFPWSTSDITVYMSGNNKANQPEIWNEMATAINVYYTAPKYVGIQAVTSIDDITLYKQCSKSYIVNIMPVVECQRERLQTEKMSLESQESHDFSAIIPYDFTNVLDDQYILYKINTINGGNIIKLATSNGDVTNSTNNATNYWVIEFLPIGTDRLVVIKDGFLRKRLGSSGVKTHYTEHELNVNNFDNVWIKIEWDYDNYLVIYLSVDQNNAPKQWVEVSRTSYFLNDIKIGYIEVESFPNTPINDINFYQECKQSFIYFDMYPCQDFEYGTQNIYDSFDFTINFIGDESITPFSAKYSPINKLENSASCKKVTVDTIERFRCLVIMYGVKLGENIVAVNLNSISTSKVCINNVNVFYTWTTNEHIKVDFESSNIYDIINPHGIDSDEFDYDKIQWRNYTFIESIGNGVILSDECGYNFYDKINGVFIKCSESIKLYTSIPRKEIILKLHTCPQIGSGLTTKELESLYVQIIGKHLTDEGTNSDKDANENNKEWLSSDPINLSHYPRHIVQSGHTPSVDKFYTKIQTSFGISNNFFASKVFFSEYSGVLRRALFVPTVAYKGNDYDTNVMDDIDIDSIANYVRLAIMRNRDGVFSGLSGHQKENHAKGVYGFPGITINLNDMYIHESDDLLMMFAYKEISLESPADINPLQSLGVTAFEGDIYFHLVDCYYETITGYALSGDTGESIEEDMCPNNKCIDYDLQIDAENACTKSDECRGIVKLTPGEDNPGITSEVWQLRKNIIQTSIKGSIAYGEPVRYGAYDSPDNYEKKSWNVPKSVRDKSSEAAYLEWCVKQCEQNPHPVYPVCKGVMIGRGYCKQLWWHGDIIPGDLNSDVSSGLDAGWSIYLIEQLEEKQIAETKIKICDKNKYDYELPYKSVRLSKQQSTTMTDLDKECMKQYNSHLGSIHSIQQEIAAETQISQYRYGWIGWNRRRDTYKWELRDFTTLNIDNTYGQSIDGKGNAMIAEYSKSMCSALAVNDDEVDTLANSEVLGTICSDEDLTPIGICGTYGFFSNEYRTFVFNIEQDINEISIINMFIESNNIENPENEVNKNEKISICIDQVELVSSTEFNEAGTIGSMIKNEINENEQSYIFVKYPVCNIEIVDTSLDFDNKQDIDTEDKIAGLTCKNYNRFLTSTCDVDQSYTTEDSYSSSVAHAKESGYSVAQSTSTSFSVSRSVSGTIGFEYQKGVSDKAVSLGTVKGEISAGFQQGSESAYSTEVSKSKTFSTSHEDGFTKTVSKTTSCSASIDVPRGYQQSYTLTFQQTNCTIPTTNDIKLTLCSYYLDNNKNNNNNEDKDKENEESVPSSENHFAYLYNVPGKIEIVQTSACKVEFEAPVYLNNKLSCDEEQSLAFLSQDIWIPLCNENNPKLYDGCQCVIGDKLTESECICTDKYGNPTDDGSGIVVDAVLGWENTCRSLNCADSKYAGQEIVVANGNEVIPNNEAPIPPNGAMVAVNIPENVNEIKDHVNYDNFRRFDSYLWTSITLAITLSFVFIAIALFGIMINHCRSKGEHNKISHYSEYEV